MERAADWPHNREIEKKTQNLALLSLHGGFYCGRLLLRKGITKGNHMKLRKFFSKEVKSSP